VGIELYGSYELTLTRAGKVLRYDEGKNLVTLVGENHAAERTAKTPTPIAMEWVAFGSDGTAPLKTDTLLGAEIAATRTAGIDTVVAGRLSMSFAFTAAAGMTIFEAGIFNTAVIDTGDMMSHFLVPEYEMLIDDVLTVVWTLEFLGVG
jgi:hypothetical protein